ncbi:2891_t:CDS:1, partial [Acaulospora morrowiae]
SRRNITTVGKGLGSWGSLEDIRAVISFGLTKQLIRRDFLLKSVVSIGELERSGLIYLSNTSDGWYTIVMPFMLLKALNKRLSYDVERIEPVFEDNLLSIPTHETPWQWQDFECFYGHFQKALIDSFICVQESKIMNI